ncbi:MAG: hypothetical protein RL557_755 [archaeon]|jgi:membrane-associated phospholipid phosphatase
MKRRGEEMESKRKKLLKISLTFTLMILGLFVFKWYPMSVYGKDILFDSSAHIVLASFVLYIIYFFIDQNKSWRMPFFLLAFSVLIVISFQRIYENAHNDIGLLLGFVIAVVSIALPNWNKIKKKIKF